MKSKNPLFHNIAHQIIVEKLWWKLKSNIRDISGLTVVHVVQLKSLKPLSTVPLVQWDRNWASIYSENENIFHLQVSFFSSVEEFYWMISVYFPISTQLFEHNSKPENVTKCLNWIPVTLPLSLSPPSLPHTHTHTFSLFPLSHANTFFFFYHTLPFAAFSEMANICTWHTQHNNDRYVCRHACKHRQY